MTITPENIEAFRNQLKEQHLSDFISNLRSEDDPCQETQSLIAVVSQSLARLIELEQNLAIEMVKDPESCPGCLMTQTRDLTKLQTMGTIFNAYLEGGGCTE